MAPPRSVTSPSSEQGSLNDSNVAFCAADVAFCARVVGLGVEEGVGVRVIVGEGVRVGVLEGVSAKTVEVRLRIAVTVSIIIAPWVWAFSGVVGGEDGEGVRVGEGDGVIEIVGLGV